MPKPAPPEATRPPPRPGLVRRILLWLVRLWRRASAPVARRLAPVIARAAAIANRNMRMTIVVCVGVVCGCFAAATLMKAMGDYDAALATAADAARAHSHELANETARALNRLATLGTAYVNAVDERSAASVMAAESDRVINVALADAEGRFIGAMKGQVARAKPLAADVVAYARRAPAAIAYSDPSLGGSPLALVVRADREAPPRFVVMLLNPAAMVPEMTVGSSALLTPDGAALALSHGWDRQPPPYALRTREGGSDLREIEDDAGTRIVALARVPGWPLAAATSVTTWDALGGWYWSIPFYVFLVLGPVVAGAGFATVMIRQLDEETARREPVLPASSRVEKTALIARLNEAERRAEEAERGKQEFLAHMSHELRTPLNAIVGFAEIIEGGLFGPAGTDKYAEYAGDIAKAGRDLHQRIGEVLEIAGMAGERARLDREPLDAVAIVRACIDQVRGFAQARGIKLEAQLTPVPMAMGDATAARRILIVLLSNALRFTQDGGTIHIGSLVEGETVVIAVRDNDCGAGEEAVDAKVAPLHAPGDRERSFGLGLAMAMALARRMGGALRIAGAKNGALIEFRLPIAREAATTVEQRLA